MSFEGGMEELKPEPKVDIIHHYIKSELDLLDKYENDLEYLRNGKMTIERKMVEDDIDDETINKKLRKLDKSIEKLTKMIENYREDIQNRIDYSDAAENEDEGDNV